MALDPQLLDILACPDTHHTPLSYDAEAGTLICAQCRRVYEVRDDIPVLLLDEARSLDAPGTADDAEGNGAGAGTAEPAGEGR